MPSTILRGCPSDVVPGAPSYHITTLIRKSRRTGRGERASTSDAWQRGRSSAASLSQRPSAEGRLGVDWLMVSGLQSLTVSQSGQPVIALEWAVSIRQAVLAEQGKVLSGELSANSRRLYLPSKVVPRKTNPFRPWMKGVLECNDSLCLGKAHNAGVNRCPGGMSISASYTYTSRRRF